MQDAGDGSCPASARPDGGAAGLRRAAAGRNRRAAGAGGDAGHAARRQATARPGLGRGLARGRGHLVQRFRSDLGLYVHLHCLATAGAYEEHNDGKLRFLPAPPPTPERMTAVLAQVHEVIRAADDNSFIEEFSLRAYPFENLRKRIHPAILAVTSSLVFTVGHFFANEFSIPYTLALMSAGLLYSYVYFQTGSIWAIVGVHNGANWFTFTFFGSSWKLDTSTRQPSRVLRNGSLNTQVALRIFWQLELHSLCRAWESFRIFSGITKLNFPQAIRTRHHELGNGRCSRA